MAAANTPKQQRTPRRRWPLAEKRRIVELTLRAGDVGPAAGTPPRDARPSIFSRKGAAASLPAR